MNRDELILNYFSKSLTEEQKREFKRLYCNDADFKAEVDHYARMLVGLDAVQLVARLKDKMKL